MASFQIYQDENSTSPIRSTQPSVALAPRRIVQDENRVPATEVPLVQRQQRGLGQRPVLRNITNTYRSNDTSVIMTL
jgi:hypothetical protein